MRNKKRIILIICASIILVVCVAVCVFLYLTRARRAVEKSLKRLSEDIALRQEESVSPSELARVADEVMYGASDITYSVNIGLSDIGGTLPIADIRVPDDITIGVDGELIRNCPNREMSADVSLSVMNYDVADIMLYASDEMLYMDVPELLTHMYEIDASDIDASVMASDTLTLLWNELNLPHGISIDLFADNDDLSSALGRLQTDTYMDEMEERVSEIWRSSEISREKESIIVTASDGTEYECRVYHIVPKTDYEDADEGESNREDLTDISCSEMLLYIDKYGDIRRAVLSEMKLTSDMNYDVDILLMGAELPIDVTDIKAADSQSVEEILHINAARQSGDMRYTDGSAYDIEISCDGSLLSDVEELSISGSFIPSYDEAVDTLTIDYSGLKVSVDGTSLLRSSGEISASLSDVKVSPVPNKAFERNFDIIIAEAVESLLGGLLLYDGLF